MNSNRRLLFLSAVSLLGVSLGANVVDAANKPGAPRASGAALKYQSNQVKSGGSYLKSNGSYLKSNGSYLKSSGSYLKSTSTYHKGSTQPNQLNPQPLPPE
jgi:hypothetical protein